MEFGHKIVIAMAFQLFVPIIGATCLTIGLDQNWITGVGIWAALWTISPQVKISK
jgi:hypothetical protein